VGIRVAKTTFQRVAFKWIAVLPNLDFAPRAQNSKVAQDGRVVPAVPFAPSTTRGGDGVEPLKPHLQTTIWTLLSAGASQREIERVTGIDRKTIRGYRQRFAAGQANSGSVATRASPLCQALLSPAR
jgi:hypothetical protein